MEIKIVVAASENNVIGINNDLPWHLPNDLKFFKKTTLGKPIIMGKNTWLSLGKPLPGRLNIVLSSSLNNMPEGVLLFKNLHSALSHLETQNVPEVCIIGGGQLYKSAIDIADTIYLTRVHCHIDNGTAFFPDLDTKVWHLIWEEQHGVDERHKYAFTFQKWANTNLTKELIL